jgi:hypothetical protein
MDKGLLFFGFALFYHGLPPGATRKIKCRFQLKEQEKSGILGQKAERR